ncbi:hypothetical protein [Comamonas sp. JC664]|uniref:hypothetical protein n=1 Tax=Comamonas sp. JC664 TaxID=2801917 RepID=UPI00360D72E7
MASEASGKALKLVGHLLANGTVPSANAANASLPCRPLCRATAAMPRASPSTALGWWPMSSTANQAGHQHGCAKRRGRAADF